MARVLVVDDDADIRRLVRISLELDGHEVTEAADGVEALRAVDPVPPDVMVLDVTMPRLDGWEVLVRLRAGGAAGAAAVPVILLTALDAGVDRIRGGVEGVVRYLTKPFDPDDLRAEVLRAMDAPAPELRRRAALDALEHLAALERGGPADGRRPATARPRVTRLGPPLETRGAARARPAPPAGRRAGTQPVAPPGGAPPGGGRHAHRPGRGRASRGQPFQRLRQAAPHRPPPRCHVGHRAGAPGPPGRG